MKLLVQKMVQSQKDEIRQTVIKMYQDLFKTKKYLK
jgi:hypothetical protein